MKNEAGFKVKLGMFVLLGLIIFIITLYFIGKQKNLFVTTIQLQAIFKTVNGLNVGNEVRFAGINIGTVQQIDFFNDSSVIVVLTIKQSVQSLIKADALVSIGTDGLMGDKLLNIYGGGNQTKMVVNNSFITSTKPIDIDYVMNSIKKTVDNTEIITQELANFTVKMNNGKGALSKLISDEELSSSLKNTLLNLQTSSAEFSKFTYNINNGEGTLAKLIYDDKLVKTLDTTMANLQSGSKGLSEIMEAAKHNFLLRGYFNKQKKAEAKKIALLKKNASKKDSIPVLKVVNSHLPLIDTLK